MAEDFLAQIWGEIAAVHHGILARWNWQHHNLEGLTDSNTLRWYLHEVRRRRRLNSSHEYTDVVLLSYPRSGSHALRGLLEILSQRPTLGDGDSERFASPRWLADRPLFLRADLGIPVASTVPVAVKRHTLWDSLEGKLVFLARDPVHSVVSHTRDMSDETFQAAVPAEVESWVSNVKAYSTWDLDQKVLIQYSELVSKPTRVAAQLVKFLGLSPSEQALQHFRTVELSRSRSVASVRGSLSVNDPDLYERQFKDRCESVANFIESQGLQGVVESVVPPHPDAR